MRTPINVYVIWYGQWSMNNTDLPQKWLPQFVSDFANSRYAHTNDTYGGNASLPVFSLIDTAVDTSSQGPQTTTLTERTVYDIVVYNAHQKMWPLRDSNALFFVLGSADLGATLSLDSKKVYARFNVVPTPQNPENGMCGYHASANFFIDKGNTQFNRADPTLEYFQFGYVGDPANGVCMRQFLSTFSNLPGPSHLTPPNDPSADGMINHFAHELMEAANDPDGRGWYGSGGESADNCAFNFGAIATEGPSNASYNLRFGSHFYLVQQQWVNLDIGNNTYNGYCGMISKPNPPTPVYPNDGVLHANNDFTVRWNDGLDGTLTNSDHPVDYAIYYEYWPYGGVEPAGYTLVVPHQPCNSVTFGTCETPVSGEPDGNFRWYAEANLDTGVAPLVITRSSISAFTVGYQLIGTIPQPLPPNPLYPSDGLQHVSSSFPVRWSDGLDASRRNPFPLWPVTYAIYYKYWPYGGIEPTNYTLVAPNQPCNSVTPGTCETSVTGELDGNYRWKVVANMDVSASTGRPDILKTESSVATFTIGQSVQAVYQGCFTDDANRALPVQLFTDGSTVENCTQAAFSAGYRFAGLQYYGQCFAGNITAYAAAPEEECNTPCNANSNQTCGGAWRNSIWSTGR